MAGFRVESAVNGEEGIQKAQAIQPDLILLDLHMPGVSGFAGLVYLCKRYPSVPVVIISANEDPLVIQRALDHGAAGFIPKSSDIKIITSAIQDILMGEIWAPESSQANLPGTNVSELALAERMAQLTPQQFKVLMMVSQGMLNKQIAYELKLSENTIKTHRKNIHAKFGVTNLIGLVRYACRSNLIDFGDDGFCLVCPYVH